MIPKSFGEVRLSSVRIVPSESLLRLDGSNIADRGSDLLRIELVSDNDLLTMTTGVSHSADLYAGTSTCPFKEGPYTWSMTRGPFPDDQPQRTSSYESRHSLQQKSGLYHYTVYVAENETTYLNNDLCLRIKGSSFFSPQLETQVIKVPREMIRHALRQRGAA
jgi:hypothetical protein